jgi:DNA-binding NarL/FixJ family response regulator
MLNSLRVNCYWEPGRTSLVVLELLVFGPLPRHCRFLPHLAHTTKAHGSTELADLLPGCCDAVDIALGLKVSRSGRLDCAPPAFGRVDPNGWRVWLFLGWRRWLLGLASGRISSTVPQLMIRTPADRDGTMGIGILPADARSAGSAARAPVAGSAAGEDVELLERDREQAALAALTAAACGGAGGLVVVEGAAGIGKTALLAAGRVEAQRAGTRVLVARGSLLEREFAYGVVRQLFEPVLAAAGAAEREQLLGGTAGQAAVLLGQAGHAPGLSEGGDGSFALLHGLFWLVANLCAQQPVALVVDDAHWADSASLRFLAYLLLRLEGLPLVVVAAVRAGEPGVDQQLLAQITTNPLARLLQPAPLSQAAATRLVRAVLTDDATREFCAACHAATGGNPLLLRELAAAAAAEGILPNASGAACLAQLAPVAVGRRVALRLTQLGPAAAAVARAVAVLGEDADPVQAAALAGLEAEEAFEAASQLAAVEILRPRKPCPGAACGLFGTLGFVHPLVRAVVYEGLPEIQRLQSHACAAELLAETGAAPEQVAAHLLIVPPRGDPETATTLRQAAEQAVGRGAPESAVAYLERCLAEPLLAEERAEVLIQLGAVAQLVDMAKAAEYLTAALDLVDEPDRRAVIAEMLGRVLTLGGRNDEAVQVLTEAAEGLGKAHADLRRQLEAGLLGIGVTDPAMRQFAVERTALLRDAPADAGLGGRMLDCMIAMHDALAGMPAEVVVGRARRGLADNVLVKQANGSAAFVAGCCVLMTADLDEAMGLLDASIAQAHLRGSISALAIAKAMRSLAWLWRGCLPEAETDACEAMSATALAGLDIARPLAAACAAYALMEQGHLKEAEAALDWAGSSERGPGLGQKYWFLESRARLLMLQGRTQDSLEAMLACGRGFTAPAGRNPAFAAWRSTAALALLALGRREQARALAAEELELARRWGAPRALGQSLRTAGLTEPGEDGLELLRQAVDVLAPSPARLEYAKALIELGAALRRTNQRMKARQYLRQGVEQAELCAATPLVARGLAELRASGARPRRTRLSGPAALTPSERRVAELAAVGRSNRDIAQTLFVTTHTVELHLTRVYRKLGITSRTDLARTLPTPNRP